MGTYFRIRTYQAVLLYTRTCRIVWHFITRGCDTSLNKSVYNNDDCDLVDCSTSSRVNSNNKQTKNAHANSQHGEYALCVEFMNKTNPETSYKSHSRACACVSAVVASAGGLQES